MVFFFFFLQLKVILKVSSVLFIQALTDCYRLSAIKKINNPPNSA